MHTRPHRRWLPFILYKELRPKLAQALSPVKLVQTCERFQRPHLHLVTDLGKELCETPLFALEREAALLTPGVSPIGAEPITLMAKTKTKASSDKGAEGKKRESPAKQAPSTKTESKTPALYLNEPNKEIRKKASELIGQQSGLHAGEGQYRATSFITWNHAVIFSSKLREHLPFRYVGKNNRVPVQVDVFSDRIVLSRYTPPTASQRFDSKNKEDAEALKLTGIASLTWNYAVILPSHLTKNTGVKSYHIEGCETFHYTSKTNKTCIQQDVTGDTVVLSEFRPPTESKLREK